LQLPTDPDFIETLWRRIQIDDLKKRFGMSEDPLLVQDTPRLSILGWNPGTKFLSERRDIRSTLQTVFGEYEGKKRRILNSYLLQRLYPVEWWPAALTKESGSFGLDILTILKVGDALQLGHKSFQPVSNQFMPLDYAFSQILEVMTDNERPLPWSESSEQAWLKRIYGDHYQQRLKQLENAMLNSAINSNPATKNIITKVTRIKLDANYRVGLELLWCDIGLNLMVLIKIIRDMNAEELHSSNINASLINHLSERSKGLYEKSLEGVDTLRDCKVWPIHSWTEEWSSFVEIYKIAFLIMIWQALVYSKR
jgi:hypothetical protein